MNQIRHPHALGAIQFSVHFFGGEGGNPMLHHRFTNATQVLLYKSQHW